MFYIYSPDLRRYSRTDVDWGRKHPDHGFNSREAAVEEMREHHPADCVVLKDPCINIHPTWSKFAKKVKALKVRMRASGMTKGEAGWLLDGVRPGMTVEFNGIKFNL